MPKGRKLKLLKNPACRLSTPLKAALSLCRMGRVSVVFSILIIAFVVVLAKPAVAEAAAFNDAASGNWNDGATWGNSPPRVEGTNYPGQEPIFVGFLLKWNCHYEE